MENAIYIKNEIDATYTNIKCKESPSRDDEDACTPLRDEGGMSPFGQEAFNANGVAAGWESDADDQDKLPAAPPPPLLGHEIFLKRSPRNDYCQTPLRVMATDESQQAATELESQQNENYSDLPNDYKDDTMALAFVKKEERRELQLGFLDVLSERDFEGVANGSYSQLDQLDQMDLEPAKNDNIGKEEELEQEQELQARIEQRQRELEQLERTASEKKRKKHKKEKKQNGHKKRRRSRSRSSSLDSKGHKERRLLEPERTSGSGLNVRPVIKVEPEQLDYVPVRPEERSVKVININKLKATVSAAEAMAAQRTIQEKRQLGVQQAQTVLHLLRLSVSKAPKTEFLVVNTIRQLPRLGVFMRSDIFENPSPLCNNFNVQYKFNSTSASNINLKTWGLEPLPKATRALMRVTGIDVTRLMELQQNTKMTLLRSTEEEENGNSSRSEDEPISTGLYKSAATQTDARITKQSRDFGVQVMPASYQGVYWLNPRFNESDLTQQQTNVLMALKELTASCPSSSSWADRIFRELCNALAIKRAELKQLRQ